jgi:formylglycine-generating enzyme required for sulfatase activity
VNVVNSFGSAKFTVSIDDGETYNNTKRNFILDASKLIATFASATSSAPECSGMTLEKKDGDTVTPLQLTETNVTVFDSSELTLTITGCSGNGTFYASFAAGAVKDEVGNASSMVNSPTLNIDNTPPVTTSDNSGQVFGKTLNARFTGTTSSADTTKEKFALTGTCEAGNSITLGGTDGNPKTVTCGSDGKYLIQLWSFKKPATGAYVAGAKALTLTQKDKANNSSTLAVNVSLSSFFADNNIADMSGLISPVLGGACDSTAGNTYSFTTSATYVKIMDAKCESNQLKILLHFAAGVRSVFDLNITKTTTGTTPSTTTWAIPYTRNAFTCPSGYVGVPASRTTGLGHNLAASSSSDWQLKTTQDFCVMQYEAKQVSGKAASSAPEMPMVELSRDDAIQECSSLNPDTSGTPLTNYSLISNTQWQTVARNLELVKTNWTSGIRDSGSLYRGHSDISPANPIGVSDASNAWINTGNSSTSGPDQKRRLDLTNGSVIWDFSGNVWEWVKDDVNSTLGNNLSQLTNKELAEFSAAPLSDSLYSNLLLLFGPVYALTTTENPGKVSVLNTTNYGLMRGGAVGTAGTSEAGMFAARTEHPSSFSSTTTGFRCVYRP